MNVEQLIEAAAKGALVSGVWEAPSGRLMTFRARRLGMKVVVEFSLVGLPPRGTARKLPRLSG